MFIGPSCLAAAMKALCIALSLLFLCAAGSASGEYSGASVL